MSQKLACKLATLACLCCFAPACFAQTTVALPPTEDRRLLTASLARVQESGTNAPAQTQQRQPSAGPEQGAPSLGDLGFPSEQTKPNPEQQARLDKRSHMLRIHQRLGLVTTVPLLATVITGSMAGGRRTTSASRDLHAALGASTAGLYFATASYAIFAPKIKETRSRGPIRLHKALAWIHGPGMVLTPILGAMAFTERSRGEKVHGIASAHAPVAYITAIAYGAAIASVSFKF